MKLLRVFMVVALLAVPLLASPALADFTADTVFTSFARIGATTTNQPIIGFTIPAAASPGADTLKTLAVKSYIERSFSIKALKLWVETNNTPGWQSGDTHLQTYTLNGLPFETQDTVVFSAINRVIRDTAPDTFYLTVDAHTDYVTADAYFYHTHGLEVVIEPGYIHLGLSSGELNTNRVNNSGYNPGSPPTIPPYFDQFKLVFDTQGPPFTLHWCFLHDGCKTDTIDQLDTLCIQADTSAFVDEGDAIDGNIELDLSAFCMPSDFGLTHNAATDCFSEGGDLGWDSCFGIPDTRDCPDCIDVDSGYVIYATARDSAGNETTASLYFDKPIDTCKPNIDSIHFFLTYDANGDGIGAIGDSLAIVAWGLSNPDFEVDSMVANLSAYFPGQPSKRWQQLDDVTNNNRLFRLKFMLEEELIDFAADSVDNRITVWAWDNACNYDTLQKMLNVPIDLLRPSFVSCYYYWHWDIDTLDCIGIGDSVLIGADLTGAADLVSVTCDLVEAGIYGSATQDLYDDGDPVHGDPTADDQEYNLLWEVGEPPIEDGKDTNNTVPPTEDWNYTVLLRAEDDAGNWDTCRTPRLNRVLDSRRPRWTNQEKIYIKQMPDAKLAIFWPTSDVTPANSCNEKDALFFYIYVDSGFGYEADPIGATYDSEYKADTNMWMSEVLSDGKYYNFKIKQEDDCGNFSDFSKELGAVPDGTPPHVCIAVPDSGLTFGDPFLLKAVADSASHDADSVCLWYRLRRDIEDPLLPVGPWERCQRDVCCCMMQAGDGWVFIDTVKCLEGLGYTGWVEIITVACDYVGNCQDTTMGYDDACLVVDGIFRPGHFLIYWDERAPSVLVTEVDSSASPQTPCGYDVWRDRENWIIFDVEDAAEGELFEVEVRALSNIPPNRIFHQDNCAMPCTVWFSVEGWDQGSQDIFIHVKDYDTGITGFTWTHVCVPPAPPEHCIFISWPTEWMRIPCTGTSGSKCVQITAEIYDHSQCDVVYTEVMFQYSDDHGVTWYKIEDVIGIGPYWTTCWDNTDLVEHGDTVYFRAIAHDQYYMADTSYMVKVFVDCEEPDVTLLIEELYYTCADGVPKVPCAPLTLKAIVGDLEVDLEWVKFYAKRHSDPDIWTYWDLIAYGEPAWSENIWMYQWTTPCCPPERAPSGGDSQQPACIQPGDFWDIRIAAKDISDNVMFDYDEDRRFDDATFNDAVAAGAGFTIFVDDDAPEPAITKVCDMGQEPPICIVNPSSNVAGIDAAYVQAGNDIYVEISPLPSEDTCTVMKVEYFLRINGEWVHVGTSTDPNHYPITFNPLTMGLIPAYELEDGWWQGDFKAELYDSLGNNEEDWIDLYILDVTPSQAVIVTPLNDSYVSGDVELSVLALNAYEMAKVCYEYSADGQTWYPVNGGYENACVYEDCGEILGVTLPHFNLMWHTLNMVEDGAYYLRATATDCDNNVDENPPTIMVTVANELPSVVLDDPRICERECPDSPVDNLGYVGGTVRLYATATSDIPVDRVEFQYKSIFAYPETYTDIGTDYFVTGGKYSVEWNTSSLDDGRYHVIARVYNAAGRFADSDPVTVSVDNSAPYAAITAIMGKPALPGDRIDITLGDVIDIELVAIDSTSDDGWTRCYNAGLAGIRLCIRSCNFHDEEITKCFEVTPATDGFHTVQWNTSGLEWTRGCNGCYWFYVEAWDCLGNFYTTETTDPEEKTKVYIWDITAPITTIGGFDGNYIYGYSTEELASLQFQYADSGSNEWIPIGWSSFVTDCGYYWYKTAWDPSNLDDGTYQVRVISHDECSNQDDDMAPIAYIHMANGSLTPYNPVGMLGEMAFLKNWCTGDMKGIVMQTSEGGTPVVMGKYGSSFDCIDMQAHQQHSTEYAGSFDADAVRYGGSAKFFSSVTVAVNPPPMTGAGTVTYLNTGTFNIAHVKSDLGTHGVYQEGCVDLTVPDGAVDGDRYIWVAPTFMEWAPVHQPDILPIGDNDGYATHVSFTDCYYCCGYSAPLFGEGKATASGAGVSNGGCCLNDGKYAIIKMCYSDAIDVDAEHLAVAWWDCYEGEYCFDEIFYPATVEGFDTENHTVEFATTCLQGPFVVVQLLERHCEGSIVVNMMQIKPFCNGYTSPTPSFHALITDNVQGTDAIDQGSIKWRIDLFNPGELVRFYDGGPSSFCDRWMPGFGNFSSAGYDEVSGVFRAGFNDPYFGNEYDCEGCDYRWWSGEYWYFCEPLYTLDAGDHMVTVTAMNDNIQTCTDTAHFMVDATEPKMRFADTEGAFVGKNPHFCMYFTDTESGVDKSSIWIDLFGDDYKNPSPSDHHYIATIMPDQLEWVDDTTVCLDLTFDNWEGGYLHVYVYGGPNWKCYADCPNTQFYGYLGGVADCVGNRLDAFWRYYTVDAYGPTVTMDCESSTGGEIRITIDDAQSGVDWSSLEFYEDGILLCEGLDCIDEESISLDTDRGILVYTPDAPGMEVEIRIKDNAGNLSVESCVTEAEDVVFGDPHNYPNPFDPNRDEGLTHIVPGLSKTCRLTVKIYDFAGEFVKQLRNGEVTYTNEEINWDGTTDGGTEVADGTYLCYIHARDDNGGTKTAVIKITVLRKDE